MLKPFHKRFSIQLLFIFLVQLFIVAAAYFNSQLLNSLVQKNVSHIILFFSSWLFLSLLDNVVLEYASRMNYEKHLDQTLHQYLQEYSMRNILNLTIAQHIEEHSAMKLTIVSKGEVATKSIIDRIIITIIPSTALIILTISTLLFYSKLIALFSLFAVVIIFSYSYYVNKKRYPMVVQSRDNWNENNKIRTEAFSHLQLVKSLHREDAFIKKYLQGRYEIVKYHLLVRVGAINIGAVRGSITEIFSFTTLALAGYFFLQGAYTVGTIYLIWNLSSRVFWQMSTLSNALREIPLLYADTEKYLELMDMKPSFDEQGKTNVNLAHDITISNLSFIYPHGDRKIFDGISFTIPLGKRVALVGSSGSGKSTIIKLLLRAYDYENGSIKIGPNELREINAGYLREHVGYVEQHVDLFDDTIKENILIGVRGKERIKAEKELESIAHKARIDQFYHRLGEKKFDTVVGERGIKLSGGERQRVGIARAIIKDPEILIFDEATSSLDSENEKYVMEAINEVSQGKTTIIIAHRLSTVRNADKIIVMNRGHVVGEGTHDELMQSSPFYQNLVAHQLS
jgi:ABC-type multidrug transport system fused ATPase/permease subunit